ncbi:MAG: Na/Pi cotransporter family protein, partial [Bacteroidota bacterium]
MSLSLLDIMTILGAVAFFIFGMKVMSDGIQRAAGSEMRKILRSMTRNPYFGVLTGFLVTAAIQSSSATTVMTVSFVNAGLLSVGESIGIIMGANIGTTITGWLIAVFEFSLSIVKYCIPILLFAVPMTFVSKGRWSFFGEILVGFALIFLALGALKDSFPDAETNATILEFLRDYTQKGVLSNLLFVLVGMMVTMVVQSSSAAMALTFVMCLQGWLSFEVAAAMVLGENIGTTITAEIAALVGNVHAKRAARVHTLFNLLGLAWMIFLLPFLIQMIASLMMGLNMKNPLSDATAIPIGVAFFHTIFNLMNTLILIWFIPALANLAARTIPSKGDEDENFRVGYITASTKTPELSILEVQRETRRFGEITSRMSKFVQDLLMTNDPEKEANLFKRIKKYEKITDKVEEELSDYLTRMAQGEVTSRTSIKIRCFLNIISELELIGDQFLQMAKTINRKKKERIWFTPTQRNRMREMFNLLDEAFKIMNQNLENQQFDSITTDAAKVTEKKINKLRNLLRKENFFFIE